MPAITLHHYWRSSSSYRVRFALGEKGVTPTYHHVDIVHGAQNTAEYLEKNPLAVVPALEVDGRVIGESIAIMEWLEETIATPALLPKDPWARARVRQMVEIVNAAMQPLHNLIVLRKVSAEPTEQATWARFFVERGLTALEALTSTNREGPFMAGRDVTFADICLVPQLYGARRYDVDIAKYPTLHAVEAALLERPACQAAHPDHFKTTP